MPVCKNVQSLTLVACYDPGLLTRVCGVLTTVGLLPARFVSIVDAGGQRVTMEIDLPDATERQFDLVSRKLGQLVLVESVA